MDDDTSHLNRVLGLLDKALDARPPAQEAAELAALRARIDTAYWQVGPDLHATSLGLLRAFAPDGQCQAATVIEYALRLAQDLEALVPGNAGSGPAAEPEAAPAPGSRGVVGGWPRDDSVDTCEIVGRWEESGGADEPTEPTPDGPVDHVSRTR